MADDADQSAAIEEFERQRGVRAAQQQLARQSALHCVDCGDDIPEQRRLVLPGVRRCITCQKINEGEL